MTRQRRWLRDARKRLRTRFGGVCSVCGRGQLWRLEFGHVRATSLNGRERGSQERYYDVVRNPDAYRLFCRPCHLSFDRAHPPTVLMNVQ